MSESKNQSKRPSGDISPFRMGEIGAASNDDWLEEEDFETSNQPLSGSAPLLFDRQAPFVAIAQGLDSHHDASATKSNLRMAFFNMANRKVIHLALE